MIDPIENLGNNDQANAIFFEEIEDADIISADEAADELESFAQKLNNSELTADQLEKLLEKFEALLKVLLASAGIPIDAKVELNKLQGAIESVQNLIETSSPSKFQLLGDKAAEIADLLGS